MTEKDILEQYVHAHELIQELDEDIYELKNGVIKDKVTGSNPEFPYEQRSFSLQGINSKNIENKIRQKEQQRKVICEIDDKAQEIIRSAPPEIQRIIRFRIEKGMSWEETAKRMGGKVSGEARRLELYRFIKNLKKTS